MATRVEKIVAKLKRFYGALPAPPSDAFELFVWQILWNHTTARKRDAAVAALRKLGALTPEGMWNASPKALAEAVSKAGPYAEQRLMGLRKGVDAFRRDADLAAALKGDERTALRRMKPLPRMSGDGPAYRMLLFAGGHAVLPVDARSARVATRLGYGEKSDDFSKVARSVRQAMTPELGDSLKACRDTYVYFEHHGTVTCTETSPHCDECPLVNECPSRQA